MPPHGRAACEAEALEVTALDLLGDGVARQEREAEAFARGALCRLTRAELPDARGEDIERPELLVDQALGARAGLTAEEHEIGELVRRELAVLQWRESRLRDADDFVLEEGL